ncbi:hypothetical protein EMCRGX_G027602 [Ephydatia muelleri]
MTTLCPEAAGIYRKLCEHYSRGCSLVSPCCGKVYPCRFCHNDNEPTHEFNRFAVSEVVCRNCKTRQPTVECCVNCGIKFGQYFCSICRLYDDADKGQFHCEKCGLCRVGGKSNYFHCNKCGLCLPISMEAKHACRAEASKANCPICMEDIHTSRHPAHIPRCGHLLHTHCLKSLQEARRYQCPLCLKSLFDVDWSSLDEDIRNTPLPYHLRNFMVQVSCHDCQTKSDTAFHFIGLKCTSCGSYNTVRLFEGAEEDDDDDIDEFENDDDDDEEEAYTDSDDFASAESELGYLGNPANILLDHHHSDAEDMDSNSSWITEEEEVIIGADDTHLMENWTTEEDDVAGGTHCDNMPSAK